MIFPIVRTDAGNAKTGIFFLKAMEIRANIPKPAIKKVNKKRPTINFFNSHPDFPLNIRKGLRKTEQGSVNEQPSRRRPRQHPLRSRCSNS